MTAVTSVKPTQRPSRIDSGYGILKQLGLIYNKVLRKDSL